MKPKSQWDGAHIRLKRLYDERVPPGMTQKQFGARYGIGCQSMVAQYLNGDRPLNFETAVKFAEALDVSIYDISPEMGDYIRDKLLPVLGKALRRAAMFAALAILPALSPSPSDSPIFAALQQLGCVLCQIARFVKSCLGTRKFLAMLSGTCRALESTISASLTLSKRPCAHQFAALRRWRTADPGSSWHSSPWILPGNIPTSLRPSATH